MCNALQQGMNPTAMDGMMAPPVESSQSRRRRGLDTSLPASHYESTPTLDLRNFIQASILEMQQLPPPVSRPPLSTTEMEKPERYLGEEISRKWRLISLIAANRNAAVFLGTGLKQRGLSFRPILVIPKPVLTEFRCGGKSIISPVSELMSARHAFGGDESG